MMTIFLALIAAIAVLELVKGLSANGTPPILQRFSWQMDLAYFMWSSIPIFRGGFAIAILAVLFSAPSDDRLTFFIYALPLLALWAGVYWLFNHFWVGRVKFLPITTKKFVLAEENRVDLDVDVIGVDLNGMQKAYPAPMLFYHHQISDEVGGQPIAATYCGMCRSGRVYNSLVAGEFLTFSLLGAVSFNAVLRDHQTGTWWRQETGEAVKGKLKGYQLEDIAFEQMSLGNWLEKHPNSMVLQHDPKFGDKYNFFKKLLAYEASLPGWHFQKTPPLIIGVEVEGAARAYDWEQVRKRRLLEDELASTPLLITSDQEGSSVFIYDRRVDGESLNFEVSGAGYIDLKSKSEWDRFGRCIKGEMKGAKLTEIQSYKEFLRAWITFHANSDFYQF